MAPLLPTTMPSLNPSPTDDEILTAVRSLWTVSNPPGVKRLVASLKTAHPEREAHINSGTVRAAVWKCETETGVSNKTVEEAKDGAGVENGTGKPDGKGAKKATKNDDNDAVLVDHLRKHIETWRDWTESQPWPRVVPPGREDPCLSPELLKPHLIPFILLPSEAATPPPPDASKPERLMRLGFEIFYLEWDCFMAPSPDDPIPPVTPLVPNEEAMRFPFLFPYGTGHYLGPEQQRGLTFEQYVLHRLHLADERFRESPEWLQWTLTRTEDAELVKAINCVLVTLHKQKARHLGQGRIQVLSVGQRFQRLAIDYNKRSKR
ncbi:hypothetical protein DFH07DRAFT_810529 [Mycena maculata]|uniref:Uncharacterized protein n=1 Tax=Mycena maculata TaxID=230809 RepID=A0AAD7JKV4_9AGAR|nr:hypothetical protein DFH07DRAFT_810529 [Mycena maculata]